MRETRALQGDTVDLICYRHYGYTDGVTEVVLEANPGLAKHGPVLPMGTRVHLPEVAAQPTKTSVQLWD
ncbi:tail protein X [Marinobacter sp. X15-166B]|uniref:tail protein X n=1 Tax=Marinobacter sp. X15-166B TaxID=1897620 RepID=UPI00085CBA19|nr:tail protein X [Marinobacter sp. X15-166B]OEY67469.1 phage tail protein [Marinobacter sp. X15-166B]